VHFIADTLVEVKTDDINTGVLDSEEAKELAVHLIHVASELLEVKQKDNK